MGLKCFPRSFPRIVTPLFPDFIPVYVCLGTARFPYPGLKWTRRSFPRKLKYLDYLQHFLFVFVFILCFPHTPNLVFAAPALIRKFPFIYWVKRSDGPHGSRPDEQNKQWLPFVDGGALLCADIPLGPHGRRAHLFTQHSGHSVAPQKKRALG